MKNKEAMKNFHFSSNFNFEYGMLHVVSTTIEYE